MRTYLTSYFFRFWNKQMRFVLSFVIFGVSFKKQFDFLNFVVGSGNYFWLKFELWHFWGFRGLFLEINKCVVEFGISQSKYIQLERTLSGKYDYLGVILTLCLICLRSFAFLWGKMPMFQRAGMREGGKPLPLAFQYLIFMV